MSERANEPPAQSEPGGWGPPEPPARVDPVKAAGAGPAPRAADAYRAVLRELTKGFDADAERNSGRVTELKAELKRLRKQMEAASDLHTVARVGNIMAWEDALEILWVEQWMTMRPFPRPDRMVKAGDAEAVIAAVEARVADLRAAVQRRRPQLPRRSS